MRAMILEKLYEWSAVPYRSLKKNQAWNLTPSELLEFPKDSLGERTGHFLARHGFDLQEKLESHDVFHVLTGTGISVPEEIGMQCYLLGNGKRSVYLFATVFLGILFYPDQLKFFHMNYKKGKSALRFHQLDFYKLLDQPLKKIKSTFLIP